MTTTRTRKRAAGQTDSANSLRIALVALAIACLAAAVTLTVTEHSAAEAWSGFSVLLGLLAGQHLPTPSPPAPDPGREP
jgi:hypothetical protein